MMQKGFFDRLNQRVNTVPSTMPLDIALLGVPIEEASCIDANHAIACIAPTESRSNELSFADLTDARPPLSSDNIFVQFHTTSANINSEFPGWVGVHLTPFSVARRSRMFGVVGQVPDRIEHWPEAYVMVVYREWPLEISIGPAGMLLGLNQTGGVIDAAMFGIALHGKAEDTRSWGHISRLTAWIVYLTFCAFTMVNQGEASLQRRSSGLWEI